MDLYKVTISQEELKNLPKKEVIFFIQCGALLNEINVLHKLILMSNKSMGTEVETKAQNSQSLFLLTILTGKLWESWRLLQKSLLSTELSRNYQDLLPVEAINSLNEIKKYFGKENLINKVRNKIAFHYDSEEIEKQFEELVEGEIPEIYLSEMQGNSLYYFSNIIGTKVLLNLTGFSNSFTALDTFFSEVMQVAKWLIGFLNNSLIVVARNHENWKLEKIEVEEPKNIEELFIPYFVNRSS